MKDLPNKIQWHPAFYAAVELEFREDVRELNLTEEYNLSKKPICIDLLIIKEGERDKILKNEIGHIMRKHNVLEYKGPDDELSIDTLYKVIGYACLYKGYGKKVNEIPAKELTVSLFREAYPRKLFEELEGEGCRIERNYPGVYYVFGMQFPVQVVVTGQLEREAHSSLRVLSDQVDIEDVRTFLKYTGGMMDGRERKNVDAVLQASVNANLEVYEKVRRDSIMCEALQELMKDEIELYKKKSREQGMAQGEAQLIRNMYKNGLTLDQIMAISGKGEAAVRDILAGREPVVEAV